LKRRRLGTLGEAAEIKVAQKENASGEPGLVHLRGAYETPSFAQTRRLRPTPEAASVNMVTRRSWNRLINPPP
jgi:hypothetical protein